MIQGRHDNRRAGARRLGAAADAALNRARYASAPVLGPRAGVPVGAAKVWLPPACAGAGADEAGRFAAEAWARYLAAREQRAAVAAAVAVTRQRAAALEAATVLPAVVVQYSEPVALSGPGRAWLMIGAAAALTFAAALGHSALPLIEAGMRALYAR